MDVLKVNSEEWTRTSNHVFWGEIAPCDHVVQIYESDEAFLELLSAFICGGVEANNAVVVIATAAHLRALDAKLAERGYDVPEIISKGQYIPVDAEIMLSSFMVYDWPDENLFNQTVDNVIRNAKKNGRQVRAFGEMVALLWAKGQVGATVRLEHLWNKFCQTQAFCLFCAYPKSGFTQDASESLMHICGAHSKMVDGVFQNESELSYKNIQPARAI
jgi:hypothetical protein